MNIDFPYHIAVDGRTAATGTDDHIRDMIEQVLFTNPGERVNRPSFGCGLLQLIFSPNSPELATATQFLIQGSLQQWLGELIQLDSVDVQSEGFNPASHHCLYRPPDSTKRKSGIRPVRLMIGEAYVQPVFLR